MIKGSITTRTKSPAHIAKLKKWAETLDDDATIKQNLVEYYGEIWRNLREICYDLDKIRNRNLPDLKRNVTRGLPVGCSFIGVQNRKFQVLPLRFRMEPESPSSRPTLTTGPIPDQA